MTTFERLHSLYKDYYHFCGSETLLERTLNDVEFPAFYVDAPSVKKFLDIVLKHLFQRRNSSTATFKGMYSLKLEAEGIYGSQFRMIAGEYNKHIRESSVPKSEPKCETEKSDISMDEPKKFTEAKTDNNNSFETLKSPMPTWLQREPTYFREKNIDTYNKWRSYVSQNSSGEISFPSGLNGLSLSVDVGRSGSFDVYGVYDAFRPNLKTLQFVVIPVGNSTITDLVADGNVELFGCVNTPTSTLSIVDFCHVLPKEPFTEKELLIDEKLSKLKNDSTVDLKTCSVFGTFVKEMIVSKKQPIYSLTMLESLSDYQSLMLMIDIFKTDKKVLSEISTSIQNSGFHVPRVLELLNVYIE